jgi:hypothetical protein
MGDINWDKVDVKKMGTSRSSSRKLLASLRLKPRKGISVRAASKTAVVAQRRTKVASK